MPGRSRESQDTAQLPSPAATYTRTRMLCCRQCRVLIQIRSGAFKSRSARPLQRFFPRERWTDCYRNCNSPLLRWSGMAWYRFTVNANGTSKSGAPGEIRTPDLLVRSQTLYPAELRARQTRSEEHTSELQSHSDLVCRLLLEKK